MIFKLNIWTLVTVLLFVVIEANGFGFRLSDSSSSEEEIEDFIDSDIDSSMSVDESDYWNLLSKLSRQFDENDEQANAESNEKWNLIDNLELADVDVDDDNVEMVQLKQYSEVHRTGRYYLGRRVRGDRIVAVSSKNHSWARAQNIKSNMTYPRVGNVGRNLTYIEIQVNQTSNLGKAYVVRGGIGKRFITVIVEAYHTLYFNFRATFYGL